MPLAWPSARPGSRLLAALHQVRLEGGEGRGPEGGHGPLVPTHVLSSNLALGSEHKCVFWAGICTVELPPEEVLVPADNFTITFHHHVSGKEQVSLVDPQYLPRRHGETWVGHVDGDPPDHRAHRP